MKTTYKIIIVAGVTFVCWVAGAQIGAWLCKGSGAIILAVAGLYAGINLGFLIVRQKG